MKFAHSDELLSSGGMARETANRNMNRATGIIFLTGPPNTWGSPR